MGALIIIPATTAKRAARNLNGMLGVAVAVAVVATATGTCGGMAASRDGTAHRHGCGGRILVEPVAALSARLA